NSSPSVTSICQNRDKFGSVLVI
ncbi:hypothetical protein D041_0649B, partial [Vibrio parahaemolyticus EKP-008]